MKTDLSDYPHAGAVEQNVLIYDSSRLRAELSGAAGRRAVEAELVQALSDGPGIVVFAGAFPVRTVVDRVTDKFEAIMAEQRVTGRAGGDHFAQSGQNDRVWNAMQKLALRAPDALNLAWRRPEFGEYFEANYVQLPLRTGDAAFFSPALFHAAGHNRTTDTRRVANLLQVSSAFGRAMEMVDRRRMSVAIFPALLAMRSAGATESTIANVIASCAEGYSFPTNLDLDQPINGLAPMTQAEILGAAVARGWSRQRLEAELEA